MKLLNDKVRHDMPLTEAEWAAWRQWMGIVPSSSSSAGKRRKRKKRRKKRLPKSSSSRSARTWYSGQSSTSPLPSSPCSVSTCPVDTCSYVSHGGALEDFFGVWGARGIQGMRFPGRWRHGPVSVYSAMLGLRYMLCVSLRNSLVYVGTDPEVDSPALAGVFNALDSFSRPLVSGSHWFGVRLRSTGSYSSASWFDSGYMYCQSTKAWFFTYFYVGLLGSCGRFSSALVVSIGSCMCKAGFF